jgi:epoxyqueuosine reductase
MKTKVEKSLSSGFVPLTKGIITMKKFNSEKITKLALKCGATLAGIANIEDLKQAPAFTVAAKLPKYTGVGTYMHENITSFSPNVTWTKEIQSVVVLAYHHPIDDPKIDYWFEGHNTIGNRKLIGISKKIENVLLKARIHTHPFNYHIENSGIFLKDSAVIAGFGCIGRNNLLLTPEYGSHIRLYALGLNLDLPSTGALAYDPCSQCKIKCWEKCPQNAFRKKIYHKEELGIDDLPGRIGNFDRNLCNIQMEKDEANAKLMEISEISMEAPIKITEYCRICEYACPIGNPK